MTELRRFLRRILALARSGRAESELSREIDAHLQLLEDDFAARGLSREDARAAARRAFGGVEQARERQRDARSFRWVAGSSTDLKLGARMLIKSPGLTVVAVAALAIAIGGGAAYFEFFNDIFRPTLAFAGGDRLVGVVTFDVVKNGVERQTAYDFTRWRDRIRAIEELGAARAIDVNVIAGDGRALPVRAAEISAAAFRVVPVAPALGRPLQDADERPDAPPVVVLGYDLWRTRFNGDPGAIGRTVLVGATKATIVGIMPAAFGFPTNQSLWMPLRLDAAALSRGAGPPIRVFGRLAPGAGLDDAQAELDVIAASAPDAAEYAHLRSHVKPYVESLWAMPGANLQVTVLYSLNLLFVGLLGICGANVATLVFARTVTREGEITVRTALGASRFRIVSQLVAEALVLTTLAAIVGLAGASIGLNRVRDIWVAAQGQPMPFWWNPQLGGETILYTTALVVLAALLIGGVPALKATGALMQGRLKQAGASGSTMRFGRLWTGIIVGQVALTVVFLVTVVTLGWNAGVLQQQFLDVSFPREEYLSAYAAIDPALPAARRATALRELQQRIAREPSAVNVTYTTRLPGMEQDEFSLEFAEPGVAADAEVTGDALSARSTRVGENYFETFRLPLLAGRLFTQGEIESARRVAIVNESFVRFVLGGRSAPGLMVRQPARQAGAEPGPWYEIVGVVRDISTASEKTAEHTMLYLPLAPGDDLPLRRIVVHARGDAAALGPPLRSAAAAADSSLRLFDVLTLDRVAETQATTQRFLVRSMGVVGAVALLLATAGIYSLVSFTLARRTREIGVRLALGAGPRRMVTGVLSRTFVPIGLGIAAGMIPSVVISLAMGDRSIREGLAAGIGVAFGAAGFVLAVAAISCTVPLRRALRIEPTQALRADG